MRFRGPPTRKFGVLKKADLNHFVLLILIQLIHEVGKAKADNTLKIINTFKTNFAKEVRWVPSIRSTKSSVSLINFDIFHISHLFCLGGAQTAWVQHLEVTMVEGKCVSPCLSVHAVLVGGNKEEQKNLTKTDRPSICKWFLMMRYCRSSTCLRLEVKGVPGWRAN